MSLLDEVRAVLARIFPQDRPDRRAREMSTDKESGTFEGRGAYGGGSFEADYNAASLLLKARMDAHFPDNYHARLGSGKGNAYDHGADRALAVDTVSTAIAAALRGGATVRQAADAGAASVGI